MGNKIEVHYMQALSLSQIEQIFMKLLIKKTPLLP